jgi:hypothetical protein
MRELLRESAKCFANASHPFSTEWLSKHDVTLDECYDLSQAIANAIRVYLDLPKDQRVNLQIKQVVNEADIPKDMKASILAHLQFRQSVAEVVTERKS